MALPGAPVSQSSAAVPGVIVQAIPDSVDRWCGSHPRCQGAARNGHCSRALDQRRVRRAGVRAIADTPAKVSIHGAG